MEDVYIVAGVRSPVGMFGKTLRDVPAYELGRQVLEGLLNKTSLPKEMVEEIIFGHGYVHGGGLNSARIASQLANFPPSVPAHVVIKACGSSLKAITIAAMTIATGQAEVIIAGGVESMSQVPYLVHNRWGKKFGDITMQDALLKDGLICSLAGEHMGVTAERLARKYQISREEQDQFAYESHLKAIKARDAGLFQEEMIPLQVSRHHTTDMFIEDEAVRTDISLERLSKLPAVFMDGGTVTAGNACPMNDGAACLLFMSARKVAELGLTPLAKLKAFASGGVEANVMGIGPVPATKKALSKANLTLADIGLIELNEAFAAQSLAVIKELELDPARVNVNGGAIALGHPVGATGAKLTVSLIHELKRRNEQFGLVTMCMAGGMGITVIYENMI